ncbi:MAG: vWA domain-containing protein [Neomegalonema sp.]
MIEGGSILAGLIRWALSAPIFYNLASTGWAAVGVALCFFGIWAISYSAEVGDKQKRADLKDQQSAEDPRIIDAHRNDALTEKISIIGSKLRLDEGGELVLTALVSSTDENGAVRPLRNLNWQHFKVFEKFKGKTEERRVSSVRTRTLEDESEVGLTLLLDDTGSMRGEKAKKMKEASIELSKDISTIKSPLIKLRLLPFSNNTPSKSLFLRTQEIGSWFVPGSEGHLGIVLNKISGISNQGQSTHIWPHLKFIEEEARFSADSFSERFNIVVTDGVDTSGIDDPVSIIQPDITTFFLAIDTPENALNEMIRYSRVSGASSRDGAEGVIGDDGALELVDALKRFLNTTLVSYKIRWKSPQRPVGAISDFDIKISYKTINGIFESEVRLEHEHLEISEPTDVGGVNQ